MFYYYLNCCVLWQPPPQWPWPVCPALRQPAPVAARPPLTLPRRRFVFSISVVWTFAPREWCWSDLFSLVAVSDFPLCFFCLLPVFLSLQQSLGETHHLRVKVPASPTQEVTGFLLKDSSGAGGSSKNSSSCDMDDFVMVPAHFMSEETSIKSLSKQQTKL